MDFFDISKCRYSARKFLDKVVEEDKIYKILETVKYAPTALNHQPYKIFVAKTKQGLDKIKKSLAPDYGQKLVFVICSKRDDSWYNRYSGQENILQDIGILGATILYSSKNEGLESCYVCNFDPKILSEELGLDENTVPECLIFVGYVDNQTVPSERHFIRRDIEEFTKFF